MKQIILGSREIEVFWNFLCIFKSIVNIDKFDFMNNLWLRSCEMPEKAQIIKKLPSQNDEESAIFQGCVKSSACVYYHGIEKRQNLFNIYFFVASERSEKPLKF